MIVPIDGTQLERLRNDPAAGTRRRTIENHPGKARIVKDRIGSYENEFENPRFPGLERNLPRFLVHAVVFSHTLEIERRAGKRVHEMHAVFGDQPYREYRALPNSYASRKCPVSPMRGFPFVSPHPPASSMPLSVNPM